MGRSIPLWVLLLCLLLWLIFTVLFSWSVKSTLQGSDRTGAFGVAATEVAAFPSTAMTVIAELRSYVTGSYRDADISVRRPENADYSDFAPVEAATGLGVDGLVMRADKARLPAAYRLLVGAFTFDGEIENAALLLSPDLSIVKKWLLDEIAVGGLEPRPKFRKFVHGLDILADGSLIYTFDGSISLQRTDACNRRMWSTPGTFHHAVTATEDGQHVWTLLNDDGLAKVATVDGSIVQEITMPEVIAANPGIDILEIRRLHGNDLGNNGRNTEGTWLEDPFHFNDVDPLPPSLAAQFPAFDEGDLLLSARSLNLVFVLDPDDLKIKWWRIGAVQRQHDPDWLENGEILVFNNRMSRDYSEIISINPTTYQSQVVLPGAPRDFYTRIRGKQQMTDGGGLVVTSPQQGWAFEVDADGNHVLDIINQKPDGQNNTNYVISEIKWFDEGHFNFEEWTCPPAN